MIRITIIRPAGCDRVLPTRIDKYYKDGRRITVIHPNARKRK